ncbi:MAG TPA: signal peptidase I [Candidatus Paceibacterota bacterium]
MEYNENNSLPDTRTSPPPPLTNEQADASAKDPHFFIKEVIKFAIIAALIVAPIRLFIAQPFIVSGASMEPTFETGQYVIVDQLSYAFEKPVRGDVVIFRYPRDPSTFFIKRIIGLPGETIQLRGKDVIIKNSEHESGIILDEPYLEKENKSSANMTVELKDTEYFVMGDNRHESSDSRIWGPLDEKYLVGRALLRLFPFTGDILLPGGIQKSYE